MWFNIVCLTLMASQAVIARDPFVSPPIADRDRGVVCNTNEAVTNFDLCLNQNPNFRRSLATCGGSSFLLGLFPMPGTSKSVCISPHMILNCMALSVPLETEDDRQQCLNFHACINRPIDMTRIVNFRQSIIEYKRSG